MIYFNFAGNTIKRYKSGIEYSNIQQTILHITLPYITSPLQWRHNGRDSVSNHQPHDCLLNRLFRRRSKKTSKLRVTGFCEFPAQMASNAEKISIWWHHHVMPLNEFHRSWYDIYYLIVLDFLYSGGKTYSSFLNICKMLYEKKIHIIIFFLNKSYQSEPFLAKMDSWLKTKIQFDAGPGYRDSSAKYASAPTCAIY